MDWLVLVRAMIQDDGINTEDSFTDFIPGPHSHNTMEQSVFLMMVLFLCLIISNCHLKCQPVQIQSEEWDKCTKGKKWGGKKGPEYYNWKEELTLTLHLDQYKEHFSTDKDPKNARGGRKEYCSHFLSRNLRDSGRL